MARADNDGRMNNRRWVLRVHDLFLAQNRGGHHAPPLSIEEPSY
jgi:hypothetical protein